MTDVTVDLDDLTTVVFAASAVKQIEGALATWKRDPFVAPHLNFIPAQKRLESAMRNAKRAQAGTLVGYDDPLTKEEIGALRYILSAVTGPDSPDVFVISPQDKDPGRDRAMSVYDQLAAKGCIEMGTFVTGVIWSGADGVSDVRQDQKGFAARLTPRGKTKLAAAGVPALNHSSPIENK